MTQSVDDTYKKLEGVTSINTGQSQAYICLKNELITVLDEKLPSLLQSVHVLADASDQESVQKLEVAYANLEAKEKPRLYQLSRLIAEKTAEAPPFPQLQWWVFFSQGRDYPLEKDRSS